MGDVVDFELYRTEKQREETRQWLKDQGVMPIPVLWPLTEPEKPSDPE